METVDRGEEAPRAPQPAYIQVHFHHESGLAKLLLGGCSLLQPLLLPRPRATSRALGRHRLLLTSWVVQIVLGVLSGILGGFLYILSSTTLRNSGAPIWTGAVAVLAGAVAFIYEKRGGIYWALLRTLLALAAFSTATAAIIIGAGRFYEYHFIFYKGICNVSSSWRPTGAPSPSGPELGRLQQCTTYMNMLKALFISINAMLIGIWVLLLLVSLLPLCLCCWRRYRRKEKRDLPLEETARSQ
ncbi:transmembrane protein 176A [Dama dama]|uniref:transmembrane protein 176A n=1 Tax=Dama dama TaxID=30532 RepID=UPI002A360A19|nr:transmembrane protein 176A [Dama dama]